MMPGSWVEKEGVSHVNHSSNYNIIIATILLKSKKRWMLGVFMSCICEEKGPLGREDAVVVTTLFR